MERCVEVTTSRIKSCLFVCLFVLKGSFNDVMLFTEAFYKGVGTSN